MRRPDRSNSKFAGVVAWLAPLATACMFGLSAALPSQRVEVGAGDRAREIAAALDAVPLRLGGWIGTAVPVPTEAAEILHANAILSREYVELGGRRACTFVVVHCSDVRDMVGHYPPVCYPANGWSLQPSEGAPVSIELEGGIKLALQRYRFVRAERDGAVRQMTVLNGFVLPDGSTTTDMRDLMARSERRTISSQGAAQVQFVFGGDPDLKQADEAAAALLRALPPSLLEKLGGVAATSDGAAQPLGRAGEVSDG